MRDRWKLLAFITRYSSTSLPEALALSSRDALDYAQALTAIVKEESKPPTARGR